MKKTLTMKSLESNIEVISGSISKAAIYYLNSKSYQKTTNSSQMKNFTGT